MGSSEGNAALLVVAFIVSFGVCLLVRRLVGQREVQSNSWAATLSYIATAYGVLVGFSILLLFGQFADARQAVGAEATSIGTAYNQAMLFPEAQPEVQRALICYARAAPTYDWPALAEHTGGATEVDAAYLDLVLSVGEGDQPPAGALHSASATCSIVPGARLVPTARWRDWDEHVAHPHRKREFSSSNAGAASGGAPLRTKGARGATRPPERERRLEAARPVR